MRTRSAKSIVIVESSPTLFGQLLFSHSCSSTPTATQLWSLALALLHRIFPLGWRGAWRLSLSLRLLRVHELAAKLFRNTIVCSLGILVVAGIGTCGRRFIVDFHCQELE